MITGYSPTPFWVPPPAPVFSTQTSRIVTNFPPVDAVPIGINPAWWPLNPAQQAILRCPAEMVLGGGASGFGKRLDLDTPIASINGWITMREIRVGDFIFDECGHPTRVTAISEIAIGDSYRIMFDDGAEIIADDEHMWNTITGRERQIARKMTDEFRTKRRANRPSRAISNPCSVTAQRATAERNRSRIYVYKIPPIGSVKTTKEIRASLIGMRNETNHSIAVSGPLQYEAKNLPIHPYVFGCWIGDGNSAGGGFTCNDPQIIEEIRMCQRPKPAPVPLGMCQCGCGKETSIARRSESKRGIVAGEPFRFMAGHGSRSTKNLSASYDVRSSLKDPYFHQILGLKHVLDTIGVSHNKHIPRDFLEASPEQRIDLLCGLMDTDGTCGTDHHCSFSNTSRTIIEGFHELVLSLGIKATIVEGVAKIDGRIIGPKWSVSFTSPFPVFRLRRKRERQQQKPRPTTRNRYIVAVEKVVDRPMRCIAVDSPSHLYLAGRQMVPTHNSEILTADAMQEYWLPTFRGLLLRENLGEMDQLGDRMRAVYEPLGANYRNRSGGGEWEFPLFDERTRKPVRRKGGARIRYGYLAKDADVGRYRGNPKSWIGIDESGMQPVKRVRTMMPWLASIDKRLRVRARFASNPGGVGASWQLPVFLRNRCPLHYPATALDNDSTRSVVPGKVYSGASWSWPPTPSELIHMTTAFFPATVFDNPLYDQSKIDKLKSQTPEIQMQLLYGCWCNADSLYFGFMNPDRQMPRQLMQDEWWMNHVISIDYGFKNSSAAASLYVTAESGQTFGIDEVIERQMGAVEFAKMIVERWIKPNVNGHPRRVEFVVMDPATDSHDDVGKSKFELMAEVFREYGVGSVKAHKDSSDNAQNLYAGLASNMLVLTTGMPQTFNSVCTRVIDDRRAVLKVHGDPLDDCYDSCLEAGTMVATERGQMPIENVTTEDMVWTRNGLRRVLWSGMTNENAELWQAYFSDGSRLSGTAEHPVFVEGKGFIRLDSISYGNSMVTCKDLTKSASKSSFIGGSLSRDTQIPQSTPRGPITTHVTRTETAVWNPCIGKYIGTTTDLYRSDTTFTTKMKILAIMILSILRLYRRLTTCAFMLRKGWQRTRANAAAWNFLRRVPFRVNSAQENVRPNCGVDLESTTSRECVSDVQNLTLSTNTTSKVTVLKVVSGKDTGRRGRVYNLSVEGDEEFFANGILVHNCTYFWNTFLRESKKPERLKLQESLEKMRQSGADTTALARRSLMETRKIEENERKKSKGFSLRGRR